MTFDRWRKAVKYQRLNESLLNTAARYIPKSGKYHWNELNTEPYNKYIKGTQEYTIYVKGCKSPVSQLFILSKEAQYLID